MSLSEPIKRALQFTTTTLLLPSTNCPYLPPVTARSRCRWADGWVCVQGAEHHSLMAGGSPVPQQESPDTGWGRWGKKYTHLTSSFEVSEGHKNMCRQAHTNIHNDAYTLTKTE